MLSQGDTSPAPPTLSPSTSSVGLSASDLQIYSQPRELLHPGKKDDTMFFLNDGVYGSFNCLLHDHATVEAEVLLMEAEEEEVTSNMVTSSLWGPTCDGEDCVMPEVKIFFITLDIFSLVIICLRFVSQLCCVRGTG